MGGCSSGRSCYSRFAYDTAEGENGDTRGPTLEAWLAEGATLASESRVSHGFDSARASSKSRPALAEDILSSILDIEMSCRSGSPHSLDMDASMANGDAQYETVCLVDDPDFRYCVCYSYESPMVIGYLWTRFPDVLPSLLLQAILSQDERSKWDVQACFTVRKSAEEGDATNESIFSTLMRAPWPFWDRETLQKRWTLPIPSASGAGTAVVCQSITDDRYLPPNQGRVRAHVIKSATLLRPLKAFRPPPPPQRKSIFSRQSLPAPIEEPGVELTVCAQLDLGGLIPQWAQALLSRVASQRGRSWAERLHQHCRHMAVG